MKLKRLDIHGFKSFYHRTTVMFDEGITGIVGPNGCGKSNIVDAIKWVMGEQGAKHLRGSSMEDVIFNGSGQRGPLGICEVGLTFQNDGTANVPQRWVEVADVAIQRRLERTKGSDYLVNKQRCRLADVQDLVSGTGVGSGPGGRRAYAIIEQGQIDRIVSAKADERRLLIEEAAGITRYRHRRRLSERKMHDTMQNLERVEDIIAEIERQMRSLRRQAKKAERYREYRDEARNIAVRSATFEYQDLLEDHGQQEGVVRALNQAEKDALVAIQAAEASRNAGQARVSEVALRVQKLSDELRTIEEKALLARERLLGYARETDSLHAQLDRARQDLAVGEGRRSELETERIDTENKVSELAREAQRLTDSLAVKEVERKTAVAQLLDARAAHEKLIRLETEEVQALARARADVEGSARRQRELTARRERLVAQNEVNLGRLREHAEKRRRIEIEKNEADEAALTAKDTQDAATLALMNAREALQNDVDRERTLRESIVSMRSRHDSLVELDARREDLGDGAKALFESDLSGRVGTVSELYPVSAELEHAVLAALGQSIDAVIMDNGVFQKEAIQHLLQHSFSRALVANQSVSEPLRNHDAPQGPGWSGYLVDLIAPQKGRALLAHLLSDAFLVDDLEDAYRLVETGFPGTVVTRAGDRLDGHALVWSGKAATETSSLSRRREIEGLSTQLESDEVEHAAMAQAMEANRQAQVDARTALDTLRVTVQSTAVRRAEVHKEWEQVERESAYLNQATERFTQELSEIDVQFHEAQALETKSRAALTEAEASRGDRQRSILDAERAVTTAAEERDSAVSAVHDAKARSTTAEERLLSLRTLLSRLERQIQEIEVRRERVTIVGEDVEKRLAELAELATDDRTLRDASETQAESLSGRLAEIRAEHQTAQLKMTEVEAALENARQSRDEIRGQQGNARVELESLRLRQESLEIRMKERYQVLMADLVKTIDGWDRPGNEEQERLEQLEALLERMGDVNLAAIEEYESVEERHGFLTTQREDLLEALSDLEKAISEIDRTSKALFKETFEAVNGYFKDMFPRLFRGGEAELTLTDPDDLLATGINMNVCPPGKKVQTVDLLSGGEKAMCAIALIFSVFKFRPSPFCLLDEVDAPLDDANIGRFNEVVREIAQTSQVVLVTHNKRTMEIADALYGVTMEESGVSKLVGVRMS